MEEIEYEAKVLDIQVEDIVERILGAGGERVSPGRLQRRWVYDLDRPGRWLRLRGDGLVTTLAVKDITSDEIDGTREVETVVGDFEAMAAILRLAGHKARAYQENRRESFELDGVRLEVDEWPRIPPYLEIEGDSEAEVVATAARLGFGRDELTSVNTVGIYKRYGLDIDAFPHLRFESAEAKAGEGAVSAGA